MSNRSTEAKINAARATTARMQADAADPTASVWVNANAGTGKTHVLTWRVLRLLLANTKPERILCLTYTKAAAAEMSKRVFETLAKWVTASDDALTQDLTEKIGRNPSATEIELARTLFTSAIETPGGLKVQTIHAFSERLLQRFPLEAGVAPGFKILDDEHGRELIARAIEGTLREATSKPTSPLGHALHTAVRYVADASFDDLLRKAVTSREWFQNASRLELGQHEDEFAAAESWLRRHFGVDARETADAVRAEMDGVLTRQMLVALRDHLRGGGKTDVDNASTLADVIEQPGIDARLELLASYFIVNRGKKDERTRDRLMSAALAADRPDLRDAADRAAARFGQLATRLRSLSIIEASLALYRLAAGVLQRYTNAKRTAGALDFDDLIAKTKSLLSADGIADWVLFKLDGGLDHILVDEAQDTSPAQWQIIRALAEEFFSGSGARDEQIRSIFAVGDEKQSIYSFQGAVPERFAEFGRAFEARAAAAKMTWRPIPLRLSFRSAQPILDAVDTVFGNHGTTPGLSASSEPISHIANRSGHAGLVEIWDTERARESTSVDAWEPLADGSEQAPANRLAERIAETIRGWLDRKETLASSGRPIRAGDILILVRKRNPFAVPMVAALKKRLIPVAGSDRIALTEQIAVQDLMALGDFLTLPEDDLQLATVLKGPLFGFNDDDLLRIATGRRGALWKALLDHAADDTALAPAAETLKRWRAKADFIPPFEFFSALLDRDGGRTKMLERLGPEAADAIDEFLDLALSYDDGAPPSLTGFLAHLRAIARDVTRDMEHGRDEVRVMTVHGAKGLEAPIVFLPDTCSTSNGDAGPRLLELADADGPIEIAERPIVWQIKQTAHVPAIANAREAKLQREREELNRLLYVAMTRARDRLYIAGFERRTNGAGRGRDEGCWYDLIHDALAANATAVTIAPDVTVKRIDSNQSATPEAGRKTADAAVPPQTPPPFARVRVTAEPRLSVPLQPSRLEPYAPDAEGEPLVRRERDPASAHDAPSPLAVGGEHRFLRGTLTHALLQHLPDIEKDSRESVARAFVARRGAALSKRIQTSIVTETLAVLNDPGFAAIFGPGSRAEVPVSAILPRPNGRGPSLELSGQIDRLAVTDSEVLIVDYKTNRPPPSDVARVADAYMYQLAAYALALKEIYPGHAIRAALLWTDGPRLMPVPQQHLAGYMTRLWDLDVASLDAP